MVLSLSGGTFFHRFANLSESGKQSCCASRGPLLVEIQRALLEVRRLLVEAAEEVLAQSRGGDQTGMPALLAAAFGKAFTQTCWNDAAKW